nr:DNA-directed DNA polymerase [Tanacetum cinerariifolium]
FKTLCFLNYALMIRQDYDITSSLRRGALQTGCALIDVYAGELTLQVNNEAVTFNLDQTLRYLANYNDMTANRINIIDMACEEYSQEGLGFSDVIVSGNPTPYYYPIVSTSNPTLTPFEDSDFLLEEVNAFLALEDDPNLPEVDHSYYDMKGDILLLEAFLNDDPSLPPPTQGMNSFGTCLSYLDKMIKWCEDTNHCLNWEKSHFMVKEGIVLGHKISKNGIEVDKAKVDIARPMTRLLEKDTPFFFSKERVEAFQTLKKKLTKAPILVAPDRELLFKLMCDASDFAIGAVLGKQKTKHFQSIHYASKTMIDAQAHYTTTKRELLAVVRPLKLLRLATMDPPGDIMAQTTLPKRCLTLNFIGPQSTVMPMTWSNLVTLVNVREEFHNEMKCLKSPSKFASFLTFGASISWDRSRLHEGTSIYSWLLITYRNGLKRKRSPPTTPELFAYENSLIYKEKTKRIHDSKIKDRAFNISDRVLLFNPRLKIFSSKLKTRWSGLFTITLVFPYGTVELSQTDGPISRKRISKKRTKIKAKTTKPSTEWKNVKKPKSKVNPDKVKATKSKKNNFRD